MKKNLTAVHKHIFATSRVMFWFIFGAILGLFFFLSFLFIFYKQTYENKIYPGVSVNGIEFAGKTRQDVKAYFEKQNQAFVNSEFVITYEDQTIDLTVSELDFAYDASLISEQAYSVGRSGGLLSNIYYLIKAYASGISLPPSYTLDTSILEKKIQPLAEEIYKEPVEARFTMRDSRVTEFQAHEDGQKVDMKKLETLITNKLPLLLSLKRATTIPITLPIEIVPPKVSVDQVNDKGIKELIGSGTSLYKGSIPNRAFNINHAANKITGVLIAPGEEFSFAKTVGDISKLTGYKEAYVISGGRTVLGDGGGVCQVSTTLFRALINAGLPITERNPHAYRVSYYEQDTGPGMDAAVYVPSVDLKFKNDTEHYLLIQAINDAVEQRLTFEIYGTNDGRTVTVSDPVILSTSPAPEPLYQDDPELPNGTIKQIDWAAPGARVYFTRTVEKDGEILSEDTFTSTYRPWQAVYLRGTKT